MRYVTAILWLLVIGAAGPQVSAAPVDVVTARQVAMNWYSERNREASTQFSILEELDQQKDGALAFYVFNFSPAGFIMVAADDAIHPVLGYSFHGTFTGRDYPPQFQDLLQYYTDASMDAIRRGLSAHPDCAAQWKRLAVGKGAFHPQDVRDVAPLLATTWNQGDPWNDQCPVDPAGPGGNAYAGCGAVAMAQVMKFWSHPTQGEGSHGYYDPSNPEYGFIFADFGATTYEWFGMPNTTATTATQQLLFHCGVSVNMDYGASGSWSNATAIAQAFSQYFRYEPAAHYDYKNNYANSTWEAMLRSELNAGRPMVYRGANSLNQGGHLFNLDGYQGTSYFHINWGWSGYYDGYYYLNDLTPGSSDFTYYQGAVFDIAPLGPGTITVISPAAGADWAIGTTQTIAWTYSGSISSVNILLSRNGGASWVTLASGTTCDGSHPWTVTGPASTNCVVRVQDHSNATLYDDSGVFTIELLLTPPANLSADLDQQTGAVDLEWDYGSGPGFYEDFEDGIADNFVFSDGRFTVADGYLKMNGYGIGTWASAYYDDSYQNFGVEYRFRRVQGSLGSSIGVFFRADGFMGTGFDNGYLVNVNASGYYGVWIQVNGGYVNLIPWTQSSAINVGLNVDNVVSIQVLGTSFDIYVNGLYVDSFNDGTFMGPGVVNVCTFDASGYTHEVWWDYVGVTTGTTVVAKRTGEASRAIKGAGVEGDITYCSGAAVDHAPVPAVGLMPPMNPEDRDFLHFTVYRDGASVATTTETTYTDGLPGYGSYEYEVTAYYDEGESDPAGPVEVEWNAPIPPTDLTADLDQQTGAVELNWNHSVGGFYEDFEDGVADDWSVIAGDWSVADGKYWAHTTGSETYYAAEQFYDFDYETSCIRHSGDTSIGIGVKFRYVDGSNHYAAYVWTDGLVRIGYSLAGVWTSWYSAINAAVNQGLGAANTIKVSCVGSNITLWVNGIDVWSGTAGYFDHGYVNLRASGTGDKSFEYVSVMCRSRDRKPSASQLPSVKPSDDPPSEGPYGDGSGDDSSEFRPIDLASRDFLCFNVYRDGTCIGTTTSITYADSLPGYGQYVYEVTAYYDEGESAPAGPVTVTWGTDMSLTASLDGASLVLDWMPYSGTAAYWVYGASNLPWFVPGMAPGYEHRVAIVVPPTTTWSSSAGIGDPDNNWIYLVRAVDASEQILATSNRVGEQDFGYDIP